MWSVCDITAYMMPRRPSSKQLRAAMALGVVSACIAGCSCDLFVPPNPPAPPPSTKRSNPVPQEVPRTLVDKEEQANIKSPIVLVPGILGSFPKNPDDIEEQAEIKDGMRWQLAEEAFGNQYGVVGRYRADVFLHIRQRLIAKGYRPDVSLFAAPYDWRRSISEIDSLHRWLKYAIATFNLKTGGSASSVDVVAHSMGALVVRNYLQTSSYEASDGKVGIQAFAIVASPQFGSADAYYTWSGGIVPSGGDPASAKFLSGLLQRMNAKIRPQPKRPVRAFVRDYVQSVRDLLPIPETDEGADGYLFGWPGGSRTPFVKMRDENRNRMVEKLNDQLKLAPLPGRVAIFLASGVKTLQEIEVAKPAASAFWEDGEPTPQGQKLSDGDGRVLFRQDLMGRLAKVWAVAPSDHQGAVCVFTPDVFKFLGIPVVASADSCPYKVRASKPILAVTFTTTTNAELTVKDPKGYDYTKAELPIVKTAKSRHFHVETPPEGVYEIGIAGDPGEHFVFVTSVTGPFAENSLERALKFGSKTKDTWQVELKQGLLTSK